MRGAAFPTDEVELLFEPKAWRWVAEEMRHRSQRIDVRASGYVRVCYYVGVCPR